MRLESGEGSRDSTSSFSPRPVKRSDTPRRQAADASTDNCESMTQCHGLDVKPIDGPGDVTLALCRECRKRYWGLSS